MRSIVRLSLKFLIGFLVILGLSAVLAPWLYTFLPFKFDRILRRLIMIGTLLLVFALIREKRESLNLSRFGLDWKKESPRYVGIGFLLGVIFIILVTLIQWGMGARFWHLYETDVWHWIGFFFKALSAGIVIGLVEEFFFRGFLFTALRDLWNERGSLVGANLIYALVHFFPKGKVAIGAHPTFWDSLRIYAAFLPSSAEVLKILPGVVGLFLFGLILSLIFLRTRSLYPSIGIHSGCVFGLKLNRRFTPEISGKMNLVTGGKNLYDGLTGIIILAIICIWVGATFKSHAKRNA